MRGEITQVTIVDTNPLVLSVGVRAITSRDSRIESAFFLYNNDIGAQVPSDEEWVEWADRSEFFTLADLPGGSAISLTLDFNTTIPSGEYLLRLSSCHNNHGESPFTIP